MKKIKTFILCGMILVSGVFSEHIFAAGIDDIRNEFIKYSKSFKYNDEVVDKVDNTICTKYKVPSVGIAPWGEVLNYYVQLFKKGSGNCRIASAYFSKKFDSEAIENRELNIVFGMGKMHSVNLYRVKDKWYVADFTMAVKKPRHATKFFAIPLEDFILSVGDPDTGTRALAFGVYNKDNRGGMDLGEFIPEIQQCLSTYNFMVYVGSRTDMPIGVRPRFDFNGEKFMEMLMEMFLDDF